MAAKPVPTPAEVLAGNVFRVRQSDGLKITSWHRANRVNDGDFARCLAHVHGRVHRYMLLEYDLDGLKRYPPAFECMAEPFGEPVEVPEGEHLLEEITRPRATRNGLGGHMPMRKAGLALMVFSWLSGPAVVMADAAESPWHTFCVTYEAIDHGVPVTGAVEIANARATPSAESLLGWRMIIEALHPELTHLVIRSYVRLAVGESPLGATCDWSGVS
jgi:hypothetical protein